MFFEGRALYSYGRHHCAAVRLDGWLTLTNAKRYSATTAKHVGLVCRHCGYNQVAVVSVSETPDHAANVADLQARWLTQWRKAKRARRYADVYVNNVARLKRDLSHYCTYFRLPMPTLTLPREIVTWIALRKLNGGEA